MSLSRKQIFTLIVSVFLGVAALLPHGALAVGQAACPCQLQDPKQPNYCPYVTCIDTTSGFTTIGKCVAPGICRGTGTSGKDGFGLDQVAKILGDLMGKLMQQGGGQQPSATPPTTGTGGTSYPPTCSISASTVSSNASSTTATLSWSSSSEATSATISPNVGTVSPNGSQSITVTATTPYTMTVTGPGGTNYCSTTVLGFNDGGDTDRCSGLFAALYGCNDDGGGTPTTTPTTTPSVSFTANPRTGAAPLTVVFTGNAGRAGYTINYGDGKSNAVGCESGACTPSSPALAINRSHVYEEAGTYTAKLIRHLNINEAQCQGTDCGVISSVTITVSNPSSATTTTTTATNTVPVFSNPAYLIPGLRGDIQIVGPAGTVIAGSRDASGNSEVAGFYGGSTFSGQTTGVVASICRSRPWAGNILSYVLPANFFDSLCSARGYQVGNPAPQTQAPTVTVTQTQPQTQKPATTTAATSSVSSVPPKVRIWAVPAKIPLGSRVSIFWTTQGVASCLVTSPDGSFSQTTLAGGASTVALTGDTTFTISCLTPDGTPVTDFVTVSLSI